MKSSQLKLILFQEQPYENKKTNSNHDLENYIENQIDQERDEKVLIYLEWFNLAGVILSIVFAVIAIFGFRRLSLCLALIFVGITVYLHFFRIHKLQQFRRKWGR